MIIAFVKKEGLDRAYNPNQYLEYLYKYYRDSNI